MALISREVWWFEPPKPGQTEKDLRWGFLEIHSDGQARFVDERPTDKQMMERKSCRRFPKVGEE
ncbi:hypothetical protein [Pseudomonas putida]|uniref:Uncharacterized protein n=1 Tax=Pseudomonas putida TaxID=303 RepID=A0A1Q9R6K4_PSEPU|nr:hypothetical protein [Pseudomonas putida]OLS63074.1 hypothetical protein PSEMO_20100 [Pseudomonas putida]